MYKDVVSPCSSYAIFSNTEAAGDVKRSAGGGSLLPLAEMGIAPSSVQVACMLQPFFFFLNVLILLAIEQKLIIIRPLVLH